MIDYVTIVRNTTGPCNKSVSIDSSGNLAKIPAGAVFKAVAQTVRVPDAGAMRDVLLKLSAKTNYFAILGYVLGTEPTAVELKGRPYHIVSERILREQLNLSGAEETPAGLHEVGDAKITARLKKNFEHSSWGLFDYDPDKDMPNRLQTDDQLEWSIWMGEVVPGFVSAAKVITPSTTSRVLLDGKPAFDGRGFHCFVQAKDAADWDRFGKELGVVALGSKYGYVKSSKSGAKLSRTITDLTTFSPERPVFDGSPVVADDRLTLVNVDIVVVPGGRLDTAQTAASEAQAADCERLTGDRVVRSIDSNGRRRVSKVNRRNLKLSTVIEYKEHGVSKTTTVEVYWLVALSGKREKLRCQTPHRYSTSENGFITFHRGAGPDDPPCVYDNGLHCMYELSRGEQQKFWWGVTQKWLCDESIGTDAILDQWLVHAKRLSPIDRERLRQEVNKKTMVSLAVLKAELKIAETKWANELRAERVRKAIAAREAMGRTVIEWDADNASAIRREVERVLRDDTHFDCVFSHLGELCHVIQDIPSSVRMVQKHHAVGGEYPQMYLVRHYKPGGLLGRINDSISFLNADGKFIGTPEKLVGMLRDDATTWAKPLTGLVEFPLVKANGSVVPPDGYDEATGLYSVFSKNLMDFFIAEPTKEDAEAALHYLKDELLAGFEFKTDEDRAMSLVCLLTLHQRRLLDTAPGFLTRAGVQQTGKTIILDLFFQVLFGRPLACESYLEDEGETDKRLLSILREGQAAFLLDNAPDGCVIDNSSLSRYLTSGLFQGRLLGKSEMLSYPSDSVMLLSGNNIKPGTDLVSRIWPISLVSSTENPMDRQFSRPHLGEWAEQNRARVQAAIACILQAYRQSGEVQTVKSCRYKLFDEMVRAPLEWLGEPDVTSLLTLGMADDERTVKERNLLDSLYGKFGSEKFTAAEIEPFWSEFGPVPSVGGGSGALADALKGFFPHHRPSARSIGKKLQLLQDKVLGGLKLIKFIYTTSKVAAQWSVVVVDGSAHFPVPTTDETVVSADDETVVSNAGLGADDSKLGLVGFETPISYSLEEEVVTFRDNRYPRKWGSLPPGTQKTAFKPYKPYKRQKDCQKCNWDYLCSEDGEQADKCPPGMNFDHNNTGGVL